MKHIRKLKEMTYWQKHTFVYFCNIKVLRILSRHCININTIQINIMKKFNFICLFYLYSICSFCATAEYSCPKPHQLEMHEAEREQSFITTCMYSMVSATDNAITASPPLKIITFLIQPNSILINGYKQPKLPDANLPYSQPPTKPDSDFGKVMSIRIA